MPGISHNYLKCLAFHDGIDDTLVQILSLPVSDVSGPPG